MSKRSISGHTRLGAFLASPASHSISPKMYNAAFEATATDFAYLAFEIDLDHLEQGLQAVRNLDMYGANVSMPNKVAAVGLMDELSPAAKLIGAINTIVHQKGKLIGHNTDGIGFCENLRAHDVQIDGNTMTLLGAGGTAAAIVCQAALDGMERIYIFNRPGFNFDKMVKKIQQVMEETNCQITVSDINDDKAVAKAVANSKLLVNATSVGMTDNDSPIKNASILRSDLVVNDVIYQPRETQLLKDAKKAGAKTINGLGMLLYQGAAAFKLFTGKDMPIEIVKPIVENS